MSSETQTEEAGVAGPTVPPCEKVGGDDGRNRRLVIMLGVAIALGTAASYCRLAQNEFVRFDDAEYIVDNPHVMKGLTAEDIRWAFTAYHSANWHPVTWISHMVDAELFGKWAGGHHLMTLALHIASSMLLLALLYYTTGMAWPSAFVAGLFALHPVHVESVAWAAERKDVLAALFWFATMLAYARYVRRPGAGRYAAVVVLFALGLLSKPMLVTLPVVLLLFDYWPLERFGIERDGWRFRVTGTGLGRLVLEKLPLLLLVAGSCVLTLQAQAGAIASQESLNFGTRLANATISYGRYICAMLWPSGLAIFYPLSSRIPYGQLTVAMLMLAVLTVAAIRFARTRRYIFVGWFWYIVTLVPVIGLVQVGSQSHADRYTYLPSVGFSIALAWAVSVAMAGKMMLRRAAVVAGVGVMVVLGALAFRQTGFWKDDLTLFSRAVLATKSNPEMLANLGTVLGERGGVEDGLKVLKQALAQKPNSERMMVAIGQLLYDAGRYEDANEYYTKAIKIRPDNWESQLGMGQVQSKLNHPAEAEAYCRRSLQLEPESPNAYNLLGIICVQTGRIEESIEAFKKAAETFPGMASARLNLARIYALKGRRVEAIDECRKSIAMQPHPAAYSYLGELLEGEGKLVEAEATYREGIWKVDDAGDLHFRLGTLLAKQGRKAEAAVELTEALKADPENAAAKELLVKLQGQ
jgi:protein O-mannosyl-transferase